MQIQEILSPKRISLSLPAASKKRLLEQLSQLLAEDHSALDRAAAFQCLIERERLGSTGIGEGVALPHGRLKGLSKVLGAFARLEGEMDYDAVDRKPVRLIFALLVPEQATEEHLKLLSRLATLFSDEAMRKKLLHAKNAQEAYNDLTSLDNRPARS